MKPQASVEIIKASQCKFYIHVLIRISAIWYCVSVAMAAVYGLLLTTTFSEKLLFIH